MDLFEVKRNNLKLFQLNYFYYQLEINYFALEFPDILGTFAMKPYSTTFCCFGLYLGIVWDWGLFEDVTQEWTTSDVVMET